MLYSEYFALANYRKYRHSCCDGSVDWPWNVYERGEIPVCVEVPLQEFIEKVYNKQARQWHEDKIDSMKHLPDEQKKWKAMNKDQILFKFEMMIEVRNRSRADAKEDKAFGKRVRRCVDYNPKLSWCGSG